MAKRHPGAHKAHQQDTNSEPDDVFVAKVVEVSHWAQHNQQLLTVAGVLVAIAIAGFIYYGNYRRSLVQQAAQQLEAVHQSISISDTEGAKVELITFLERFSGTPYEGEARLLLGNLYLTTGDPQQAQAVLEPLGASPRDPIDFQGAALLGAAYEQDARWTEAEATYLRIADRSELDFQVRQALAAAARIRAEHGDPDGAIELYQRVLGTLDENDTDRGLFEMRIEELRAASSD